MPRVPPNRVLSIPVEPISCVIDFNRLEGLSFSTVILNCSFKN
jgi:hypothetical protein